jgi:MoxR-like ATPase
MIVCLELGIPLIVVGHPGASKSLAKAIVQDTLRGKTAEPFFRIFRRVEYFAYLCSPHSTAAAITSAHAAAKGAQRRSTTEQYAAVLVLDELGLAEDAESMPLKCLHTVLEDRQVGFLGISNWAIDPAKMSRSLVLSTATLSEQDLVTTAEGIACDRGLSRPDLGGASAESSTGTLRTLLRPLAEAYLEVTRTLQPEAKPHFFGLRDFYSLIQGVRAQVERRREEHQRDPAVRRPLYAEDLAFAVCQSFGGTPNTPRILDQFMRRCVLERETPSVPLMPPLPLLLDSIMQNADEEGGRYLLLLSNTPSALELLFSHHLLDRATTQVINGSLFPNDQRSFSKVCLDVHRVRTCLETGQPLVLQYCDHIFETLYDVLNKYFTIFAGQRFTQLGIGHERDYCKVAKGFKLVVLANPEHATQNFPVPFLNRFQKQRLDIALLLSAPQLQVVEQLTEWVEGLARLLEPQAGMQRRRTQAAGLSAISAGFVGLCQDTLPSLIHTLTRSSANLAPAEALDAGKHALAQMATAELALLALRRCPEYFTPYFAMRCKTTCDQTKRKEKREKRKKKKRRGK